jgi:hypothetical protein
MIVSENMLVYFSALIINADVSMHLELQVDDSAPPVLKHSCFTTSRNTSMCVSVHLVLKINISVYLYLQVDVSVPTDLQVDV